jgi:hypothetical protein
MEIQLYLFVASIIGKKKKSKIWIKSFPKLNFVNFASEATSDLLLHENKCKKRKQCEISEIA